MQLSTKLIVAAATGIASHNLLFIHGEWHMQAPRLLRIYLVLTLITCVGELRYSTGSAAERLGSALIIVGIYALSLLASLVVYRTVFHRLRNFPGPFWARVSKFWHVEKCISSSSQNYIVLDRLHKKYGNFVRTGPNEISVFHPDVFAATDGPGNTCRKAVWYDFLLPEVAVNTTRDKPAHDQRRRIWDHGFTKKALTQYDERIRSYATYLEEHIAKSAKQGQSVDVTAWFYWFSFDVMGDFAFAKSFDMLRDEKWHHVVLLLRRAMSLLGPLSPVPWLAQIGFSLIPGYWVVKDWHSMMNWCKKRMTDRISMEPDRLDVSSYLIDASIKNNALEQDRHWLNGDSIAIIIAGSDTVAPTLVFLFYELARNPSQADKLHTELTGIDLTNPQALQDLPHLNALINETLRIHPAVPSGGYRETPPAGLTIADTFIPGGTTIVAPRFTIGRLESCFQDAEQFVPERWYSRPEMVRNRKAFAPFSQGRYSCVGKQLALSELRYVASLLVGRYHIGFAQGESGADVEGKMRDQFTAAPGGLRLLFTRRED